MSTCAMTYGYCISCIQCIALFLCTLLSTFGNVKWHFSKIPLFQMLYLLNIFVFMVSIHCLYVIFLHMCIYSRASKAWDINTLLKHGSIATQAVKNITVWPLLVVIMMRSHYHFTSSQNTETGRMYYVSALPFNLLIWISETCCFE